jgi:hypothetical protein
VGDATLISGATSCVRLDPGLPDSGIAMSSGDGGACGASSDPFSPGYPDLTSADMSAGNAITGLSSTQQANIMRGTPSGCPANLNYTDFF